MSRPEDIEKVLRRFPIEDVWGISRKYRKMLHLFGILTAWQFTQASPEWIRGQMSIVGLRTWKELRGEPCIEFENATSEKQSICVSRSFTTEISDLKELKKAVSTFAAHGREAPQAEERVRSNAGFAIQTDSK